MKQMTREGEMSDNTMSDNTITLKDIFFREPGDLKVKFPAAASVKSLSALQDSLRRESDKISFRAAMEEVIQGAQSLMNIKIEDVLLPAWKKYLSLRKYLDKDKYPPETTSMVPVAEHTVKSEHHPFLELLLNDTPVGRIDFTIAVTLVVKGMILVIRDGKIRGIKTGECRAKGTVSCENIVIVEKISEIVVLPGTIACDEGIPIV
jgi:hypothetical protein